MMESTVIVSIAFYHRKNNTIRANSIFRRFIQGTQTIWHVEIAFPPEILPMDDPLRASAIGTGKMIAYGIFATESDGSIGRVFERERIFTSPNYIWIHINVSKKKALEALHFAKAQVGKPYDTWGHIKLIFFPSKLHINTPSWICSTLTAAILSQMTEEIKTDTDGESLGGYSMDDIYLHVKDNIKITNKMSPMQEITLSHEIERSYPSNASMYRQKQSVSGMSCI